MKTIYVCEDSVTGIYSGIYDAWKSGKEEGECGIALKGLVEQELKTWEKERTGTSIMRFFPMTERKEMWCLEP